MRGTHSYNKGINFIRAYSIIAIMLYHFFPYFFKGGFLGVCFFFVISGYLVGRYPMGRIVHTEDGIKTELKMSDVALFYKKRFLRIYPTLYAMLVVVVAFLTLTRRNLLDGSRPELASILFSYNNWWQIKNLGSYFEMTANHSLFRHLWYLSVEVQLLILWPIVYKIYIELKNRVGKVLGIIFLVILAVISSWLMIYMYDADNINRIYYGTDTRAFAFLFGAILGLAEDDLTRTVGKLFSGHFGARLFSILMFANLVVFLMVDGTWIWVGRGGMVVISLIYALMIFIMNCSEFSLTDLVEFPVFDWIGKNSYWLYLWHYPVFFIVVFLLKY